VGQVLAIYVGVGGESHAVGEYQEQKHIFKK